MLLDESDIAAIVEHLGDKVQFYDVNGLRDNVRVRNQIRDALRSYVGTRSSKSAERFDLVKVGADKMFDHMGASILDGRPRAEVSGRIVAFADAVLAAMEQTSDTGPSADEIVRRALKRIRDLLQEKLDAHQQTCAMKPTEDNRVRGCRNGFTNAYKDALVIVDVVTGEAEDESLKGKT